MAWEEDHVARITRRFVDRSAAIKALIRGELAKPTAQKWAKYLERAKRSDSKYLLSFPMLYQSFRPTAHISCWTLCWTPFCCLKPTDPKSLCDTGTRRNTARRNHSVPLATPQRNRTRVTSAFAGGWLFIPNRFSPARGC